MRYYTLYDDEGAKCTENSPCFTWSFEAIFILGTFGILFILGIVAKIEELINKLKEKKTKK